MFAFANTLLNYLFYSSLVLPNSSTVCKTMSVCPIVWDSNLNAHAHIEVQVKGVNNSWSPTTDMGQSFLSVIVDSNTHSYDWFVPHMLGKYWESPKRVVLEDLTSNIKYYSADFTVPGITFTMNSLDADSYSSASEVDLVSETSIPLTWSSNDNSQFSLHLMKDSTIINTINNGSLPPNSSYIWKVTEYPENLLRLFIQSIDEKTYAMSGFFNIIEPSTTMTSTLTTTMTSTLTTTMTSTITNSTPVEPDVMDIGWYFILFIIICSISTVIYLIYKLHPYCLGTIDNVKVHPEIRAVTNPNYERQSISGRPLPPLPGYPLSSNAGSVYHQTRNTRRRSQGAEYNILDRNQRPTFQNEIYEHTV